MTVDEEAEPTWLRYAARGKSKSNYLRVCFLEAFAVSVLANSHVDSSAEQPKGPEQTIPLNFGHGL